MQPWNLVIAGESEKRKSAGIRGRERNPFALVQTDNKESSSLMLIKM